MLKVYDGSGAVIIPPSMGTPLSDQCQGTPLEVLGEIASRICYDSLGLDAAGKRRGRSSSALHAHILEVRNHSVYEHCNYTVRLDAPLAQVFANRKGVWIEPDEVTINLRAVIEWEKHYNAINNTTYARSVISTLRYWGHKLAPAIIPDDDCIIDSSIVEPTTDDQRWISCYLCGSRGWSHEQVRHRFAMSQRSTRYVDESSSPYCMHPLIKHYLSGDDMAMGLIAESMKADRRCYDHLVAALTPLSNRKQARGAARGYLGNALFTEMIFSAPLSGWKWMYSQRANILADAEIRSVFTDLFDQMPIGGSLSPSPDGIGKVWAPLPKEEAL